MLTLLIGAGFSKWSMNLPVISQLFDFDVSLTNPREIHRLELLRNLKEEWDKSNPNTNNELFIWDCLSRGIHIPKRLIWYISRRLSEPFISTILGGRQAFMIDDSRRLEIDGIKKAAKFFNTMLFHPISGIVTTNYDLIIEYSLGTNKFNYGRLGEVLTGRGKNPFFPWQSGPVKLTGTTPIAKLHGSLSWDESHRYTDGRAGVRGNALIIPPSYEKKPNTIFSDVWKLASQILSKTTHILVFGFAFNPHDEAVLSLLANKGNKVKKALLVDIAPPTTPAQEVWPNAEIIPVMPSDSPLIMKKWVKILYSS